MQGTFFGVMEGERKMLGPGGVFGTVSGLTCEARYPNGTFHIICLFFSLPCTLWNNSYKLDDHLVGVLINMNMEILVRKAAQCSVEVIWVIPHLCLPKRLQ